MKSHRNKSSQIFTHNLWLSRVWRERKLQGGRVEYTVLLLPIEHSLRFSLLLPDFLFGPSRCFVQLLCYFLFYFLSLHSFFLSSLLFLPLYVNALNICAISQNKRWLTIIGNAFWKRKEKLINYVIENHLKKFVKKYIFCFTAWRKLSTGCLT